MKKLIVNAHIKSKEILFAGILAVLVLPLALPTKSYAAVTLTSADRGVSAYANVYAPPYDSSTEQHNSAATGSFVSTATASDSGEKCSTGIFGTHCSSSTANAFASQDTNLTVLADSLSVSGNLAYNSYATEPCSGPFCFGLGPTPPDASAMAKSFVDLIFSTDSAANYAFTFSGNGFLTMKNLDTLEWILYGNSYPFTGTIGTGNYDFKVWIDSSLSNYYPYNNSGSFDFSFTVSSAPVPEPETYAMLLAGLGLLGFAALRRKELAA